MTPFSNSIDCPLDLHQETVRADWVDYNGHMNVAYYVLIFDHASDAFFEFAGIGESYRARDGGSTFIVESHITYDDEITAGAEVTVSTRLIDFDAKRIHLYHEMRAGPDAPVAATIELMALHMDMNTRRVAPVPDEAAGRLADILKSHTAAPRVENLGRIIGIRRKG